MNARQKRTKREKEGVGVLCVWVFGRKRKRQDHNQKKTVGRSIRASSGERMRIMNGRTNDEVRISIQGWKTIQRFCHCVGGLCCLIIVLEKGSNIGGFVEFFDHIF